MSEVLGNAVPVHTGEAGRVSYDAVIVGAGSAGLSAALVLGRSRRRVLVLDGGEPRNAPSAGVHGFFTRDGVRPGELLEIGRGQLEPYESVEYRVARATEVSGSDGSFGVRLEDGDEVLARKLVLATGVVDELPERPGFRELWGRGVYHCPYCHGWEVRDRPLAVLISGERAAEYTLLIRNWSRDLVLLTDGPAGLEEEDLRRLRILGMPINEKRIARLEGRSDGSEGISRVHFEDGSSLEREGLFYGPPQRQRSGFAETLGCEIVAMGPAPAVVKADPMTRETSVPGVYVAGDAGSMLQSIALTAASGANAAAFLNHALCDEDAEAEASYAGSGEAASGRAGSEAVLRKHAADGSLYDRQGLVGAAERPEYADSGSAGVEDFVRSQLPPPPARVLEVGCGSGKLALALSAGGWRVIAVDPEAPESEPFVRAAVEELDAADYEPFDAAVAVLSLHHAGGVGVVLDKVRSLLKPGGVLIVDEFRKEHLADKATAAFFYHQRLSLFYAGRNEIKGGGHLPGGDSFESWFSRLSGHRAGVHEEGEVLAALGERFTTRSLSYGPFLFRHDLDEEVEPLESKLIAEGGIRPTGLRWVGILGTESDGTVG